MSTRKIINSMISELEDSNHSEDSIFAEERERVSVLTNAKNYATRIINQFLGILMTIRTNPKRRRKVQILTSRKEKTHVHWLSIEDIEMIIPRLNAWSSKNTLTHESS